MTNLADIEKRYKSLPTAKLIQLAAGVDHLQPDVIPLLDKELLARGEGSLAAVVEKFSSKSPFAGLSLKEIQELVTARLQTGESIESIKVDLADHGTDITELLNVESEKKEQAFELLSSSKGNGLGEVEVKQKLNTEMHYDEGEIAELKQEMVSRARFYVLIGSLLIVIAVGLLILFIGSNQLNKGAFVFLGGGISLLIKGLKQRKG